MTSASRAADPGSPDSLEISASADESFAMIADRLGVRRKWRLAFEYTLPKEAFHRIRAAAAFYISACLGRRPAILDETQLLETFMEGKPTLANLTPNGHLLPKREHILEFNHFHRTVSRVVEELGITDLIQSVQRPVTMRVIDGSVDPSRDRRPYATSILHSDVWAGDPVDAVAIQIPIFGDTEHFGIEFGEIPPSQEIENLKILDGYQAGSHLASAMVRYPIGMELGRIYFMDIRSLHRTVRGATRGMRISFDVRFRRHTMGAFQAWAKKAPTSAKIENYVPFSNWRAIGESQMIVFDETCEDARTEHACPQTTTRYPTSYRVVTLDPPPGSN